LAVGVVAFQQKSDFDLPDPDNFFFQCHGVLFLVTNQAKRKHSRPNGDSFTVQLEINGSQQFYRLRK
jgi:hypothetical protein